MENKFLDSNYLMKIAKLIEGDENKRRKALSMKRSDVYNGRLEPYVIEELRGLYEEKTIEDMPIQSSINIQQRVVNEQAGIYKDAPIRSHENEKLVKLLNGANSALYRANVVYKNQDQCALQVLPTPNGFKYKVLQPHHYDVVPFSTNPEEAEAYIISVFDYENYRAEYDLGTATGITPKSERPTTSINTDIADDDDYEAATKRYVLWTRDWNFMFNDRGEVLTPYEEIDDLFSPLISEQILPFIDIVDQKEFNFWVDKGSTLTDMTVQFNAIMSDTQLMVRYQNFSQGWIKGPAELLINDIRVGPNKLLKLTTDPSGQGQDMDMGFAQTGADIGGTLDYLKTLLSLFLTSQGVNPKAVSGNAEGEQYSSGVERLLALFEKFEASRQDYELFKRVEKELFSLVVSWVNALRGTELDFKIGQIDTDSDYSVKFSRPEQAKTESEKLDSIERRMDMGLIDRIGAYAEFYEITEEQARERIGQTENIAQ